MEDAQNIPRNDPFTDEVYFNYINTKSSSELSVLMFGYECCRVDKTPQEYKKAHYSLHYVVSGKGTFQTGGKSYTVLPGQMFYMHPMTLVHYAPDPEDPWTYLWFEINGIKARELVDLAGFSVKNPVYTCQSEEILPVLYRLFSAPANDMALEYHTLGLVMEALALVIDERAPAQKKKTVRKAEHVQRAVTYIDANFTVNQLSLKTVASYLFLNSAYLSRIFKEVTGVSVSKYITSMRIQRACMLLEQGGMTVKDIARQVGYRNVNFFSKEFKKHRGIAPGHYTLESVYKANGVKNSEN